MMRGQQMDQSSDSKSTFERRPSQRFASRRSRMDRTRPNIISSSANKNSNINNNNIAINNNNTNHSSNDNKTLPSGKNESISNKPNESQQVSQQQSSTVKPNIVMNSVTSRHQLSHGKPVKPPTVPSSVSFAGITQQAKLQDHHQQQIKSNQSVNNNNIHQQSISERRKADFADAEPLSKVSIDRYDQSNQSAFQNVNSSIHPQSKSQPQPLKSHHNYINYKPPNAPPPPTPKTYDQSKQHQRVTKSEEEQQDQSTGTATNRKTRLTSSGDSDQNHESSNNLNQQKILQQGELLSSSSMPPPPPPPDLGASRSMSSREVSGRKQPQQNSQPGMIGPICITEL